MQIISMQQVRSLIQASYRVAVAIIVLKLTKMHNFKTLFYNEILLATKTIFGLDLIKISFKIKITGTTISVRQLRMSLKTILLKDIS